MQNASMRSKHITQLRLHISHRRNACSKRSTGVLISP